MLILGLGVQYPLNVLFQASFIVIKGVLHPKVKTSMFVCFLKIMNSLFFFEIYVSSIKLSQGT